MSRFKEFSLSPAIIKAVSEQGYTEPSPIQAMAIPDAIKGSDILGCAQTGTGKTAAFALPMLERLSASDNAKKAKKAKKVKSDSTEDSSKKDKRKIRGLVLSPTRELAVQICESFKDYGRHLPLKTTVIYGGVRQRTQTAALKKGVDIVVATPGRLLDLMGQGFVDLSGVEIFVLDEADRMLDMGFIDDIRKIIKSIPKKRQTLFFSATMPYSIKHLADSILTDPIEVHVEPESVAVDTVDQSVYMVERNDKQALLEHILADESITRALVFTQTKRMVDRVTQSLKSSKIKADSIHSDKPQKARQKALDKFKAGTTRVLVASDIAARGIDVDDVSHVINYDMPMEAEVYVHRIGRTGRAGSSGKAYSFCDIEERSRLADIEKLMSKEIEYIQDHPYPSPLPFTRRSNVEPEKPKRRSSRRPLTRRLGRR